MSNNINTELPTVNTYTDNLFELSLNALPVCAYICDAEGLITFYNQKAISLWGRTPKLNDYNDRFCGAFGLYSLEDKPIDHEDCFMDDYNESYKAAKELSYTESLLRNLINTSQDLIFVKDKNLRTILCNKKYAAALNKKPEELYGKTDIENGWPVEMVKGNPEKNIRGFEADDKDALAGNVIHNPCDPAAVNGETRIFDTIKSPLINEAGDIIGLLGISRDVTERKAMEDDLTHRATHDGLTGLYNRSVFEQRLTDEIYRAARYKHALSIFMIDLDHFKYINDNHGHRAGDIVLQKFAQLLESLIRKSDHAARYGGEEFVVVLPETSGEEAEDLAKRTCKKISEYTFEVDHKTFKITVSIGIASYPVHAENLQHLIEVADAAMYAAKKAGRNQIKTP